MAPILKTASISGLSIRRSPERKKNCATTGKLYSANLQRKGFLKPGRRLAPQAIYRAALEFLAASKADIVLLNLEDLWQETQPQNVRRLSTSAQTGNAEPNSASNKYRMIRLSPRF